MKLPLVVLALTLALNVFGLSAGVRIVPVPEGELPSSAYRVTVDSQALPLSAAQSVHGGDYAFGSFDLSGSSAAVAVITGRSQIEKAAVLPRTAPVEVKRELGKLTVVFKQPCQVSVEPAGIESPLLLFANPPEKEEAQVREGAPNVVYFGPGVHKPERIVLKSNQTLYLAAGAVVKGTVFAKDAENVRICGRGMLDGTDWAWEHGPSGWMIGFRNCRNVLMEDVVVRGSWGWTLVPAASENVTIRNVKVVNSRVQNDDAIDICNSREVTIERCFLRSDDDCIAVKGLAGLLKEGTALTVENLQIRNCVFWCDRARIFLLGHESVAPVMNRVEATDCDIIHFRMTPFLLEPGEEMTLSNIRFENFRVECAAGQRELVRLFPTVNQYMKLQQPGHIEGVLFSGIQVSGSGAEALKIQVKGTDAEHAVRDVSFRNVSFNGKTRDGAGPAVEIGQYTEGVRFENGAK